MVLLLIFIRLSELIILIADTTIAVLFENLKKSAFFKICLVICFTLTLHHCSDHSGFDYPEKLPEHFDFKAVWHFEGKVIDSSQGLFRQALSFDTDTTVSFELTQSQKEKTYQVLKRIDIFGYSESFAPPSLMSVFPSSGFYLEVEINGVRRKINWEENVYSSTEKAIRLRGFFELLDELLVAHPEIQELPEDDRLFL